MRINGNTAESVKIAYIGGGSRGWARVLMSDLAKEEKLSGEVCLYDIDYAAAKDNETIGNMYSALDDAKGKWVYKAVNSLKEALTGADFVIISILPGTFDEMESDVHAPEKYGIYQSVGDTVGPGGIVRGLRTVPMYREIAEGVRDFCPDAWVINYTNPMSMCVRALYEYFPKIKAFGCCHEVFGTQGLVGVAYEELTGEKVCKDDVKINVLGINHFTWITSVSIGGKDMFPVYADFAKKYYESGFGITDDGWLNNFFANGNRVKFDLFRRYGVIAAAGDRHLAEFCPGDWYLASPERAHEWKFGLTPVSWRKKDLETRIEKTKALLRGEESPKIVETGEEGVRQMKAILGLSEPLVTNVNLPNVGQMPGVPAGAVVETNAVFSHGDVRPVASGELPNGVTSLVMRHIYEQETTVDAAISGDYGKAYSAFTDDPLMRASLSDSRKLFDEMLSATAKYLPGYRG